MLSEEERQAIDEAVRLVPRRRAACIEALQVVQRSRGGHLTDEALADVAAHLGLSVAELDGVATFYNLLHRRPVGRHVIRLCDSVSCWIAGGEDVEAAFHRLLGVRRGETTADGRFTLLPMQCLGACEGAPALMVDDDLHTEVGPESVAAVLERYR